jgi:4-amino-4-deoxy-L-arabinose transferase-like glycosyltransferase
VPPQVVGLGVLVAIVAVVGWWGALAVGPAAGPDAAEHIRYAQYYDTSGRLPAKGDNYEYASPPGFHVASVYLQRAARRLDLPDGAPASFLPSAVARLGWLALLIAAGLLLASARASGRARVLAAGAVVVLVALAVVAALAHMRAVAWSSGQVIALLSACGIVAVAWGLARSALPGRRNLPLAVAAATAVLPVVLREGVIFHPELPFAFLVSAAVLVFVRGVERGFAARHAAGVGVLLGLAALTRQTAAMVAVVLGIAALVLGGRAAFRFVAVATVAVAVVAGPWWGYQAHRFGNPLQANLDRPGYMLPHGQPATFYVSFPIRDLILHPYRNAFSNQLLPKFHADLWSDWYGVDRNYWASPDLAARVLASTQSVLGLVFDVLAVVGLLWFGARAVRRREGPVLVTLTILFVVSWATFVATLVHYPQAGGDPIKASYVLFLAPAAALYAVLVGDHLWRRGRGWRLALVALCALYGLSFLGVLVTTY